MRYRMLFMYDVTVLNYRAYCFASFLLYQIAVTAFACPTGIFLKLDALTVQKSAIISGIKPGA